MTSAVLTESTPPTHVVGIGASAGGLEAIQAFLESTPADLGVSFVIIQHLSPDFKSMMDELLIKYTRMPIHQVHEGVELLANNVYLIPSGKLMRIMERRIYLSDLPPDNRINLPINEFFRSLAEDLQNQAIGVILSGTGSDGSRGILALKEVGGLVIAQEPSEAQFDGMPVNAIATGAVDFVTEVRDMPAQIQHFISHPLGSKKTGMLKEHLSENTSVLEKILDIVQQFTDLDFKAYKESTVARRIAHRMGILGKNTISSYYEYIKSNKVEVDLIKQDLLIGVTQFFRDIEVWDYLSKEVIEPLVLNSDPNEPIRIWSTGCSTGEEPYTIAMLFLEAMEKLEVNRNIKVFASDVDQTAVSFAANGLYPTSIESELPSSFISKYFNVLADGNYQVTKQLRSQVVFATHNLIQDPPFSNMDLISCRNALIYLQNPAQQKAFAFFHFALKLKGVLLLGSAETPGSFSSYFETIDSRLRLYRKNRELRIPVSATSSSLLRKDARSHSTIPQFVEKSNKAMKSNKLRQIGREELWNQFVPSTLVFNSKLQLIYTYGDTEPFTRKIKPGLITNDIGEILAEEIAGYAISAAHQVKRDKTAMSLIDAVKIKQSDGSTRVWTLKVFEFIENEDQGIFTGMSFIPSEKNLAPQKEVQYSPDEASKNRIQELNDSLLESQKLYREAMEDLDTTSEELQSSNEELMAANEELQSTNEELQSVNEELFTVNSEHQQKILELTNSNSDLENLLKASQLAVLFLDEDLRIRRFTHAIKSYINIIEFDMNRDFRDITFKYDFEHLNEAILEVNNKGSSVLECYEIDNGDKVEVSITPYIAKTKNAGVVVSMRLISSNEIQNVN